MKNITYSTKNDVIPVKKPVLYLDMDGVVFNTVKCIVDLYNEDFKYYENFRPVNWLKVDTWGFKECKLASRTQIMGYFNQPRFFDEVEWMPDAEDVIDMLSDEYDITFVTKGDYANLRLKENWWSYYFPSAEFIGIDTHVKDKAGVDMSNGIFLDDSSLNLKTCNAKEVYCFGRVRSWNSDWDGERLETWIDVYNKLLNKGGVEVC